MISTYFVEFIFYSFLGWIWESIYCTIKKKEWQDRGFLFGPICPIYGSCVVVLNILFGHIPQLSSSHFPLWGIFLICMVGSAIAEFSTSWVLEKRFHAMWWDYSNVPLNLQGRICLPVSVSFGLAGVVIVRFVLPVVSRFHMTMHPVLNECLALGFAMLFGADFALTEASLSSLLKNIENYKAEWNRRAEVTYSNLAAAPKKLEEGMLSARESVVDSMVSARDTVAEGMQSARESVANRTERMRALADSYADRLNPDQIRILNNIQRFRTKDEEDETQKVSGLSVTEHLRNSLKLKKHHS